MIKIFSKKIIIAILFWEAKILLRRFRPKLIGVSGSVGKTAAKEAIFAVLNPVVSVGKSDKSYNSEFGVPLAILGEKSALGSISGWISVIYRGFYKALFLREYPDYLVLEVGSDRPGDISTIARHFSFSSAVLTSFPDLPVHIEFFSSAEDLHNEDFKLAESISSGGLVVLNADEKNLARLAGKTNGQVLTYGFSEKADIRASEERIQYKESDGLSVPVGMSFHVSHAGTTMPVTISGVVGRHQIYPVLAALSVGLSYDLNLVHMIEGLSDYSSPAGRMKIISGNKKSIIIDDTYNSSPAAALAARDTLKEIDVIGRRIAVIGDMLELGNYTIVAHRDLGKRAKEVCDIIFTVGLRAKFSGEAAVEEGFAPENWQHFTRAEDAGPVLDKLLQKGDLVLVKGSQGARLEKIVEEIMADPEKAGELLCRQDSHWKS